VGRFWKKFILILTDLDQETKNKLGRAGLREQETWIRFFPNMDYSGELTTRLEISKGKFIRLRNQGGGTMVGEMGLFLKQSWSATVVATRRSVLYRLSLEEYNRMMQDDPELAFPLQQWIGRVLSVRLAENNHTLGALLS
jgi:hypothetical protein